jgi:hypothetical protein
MSALSIQPTYPIFTDIDGQPLEDGYVWIGTANLDPQTNPISVFFDAALTIPAAQPIRTISGYPANAGTPGRLYVNSDYSIRVMNKNGTVVYSAPAATERYNGGVISTINANQVVYDPAGIGAVSSNVQTVLRREVWVEDFLPANFNYATDDAWAYIKAAIDSGAARILFDSKTYRISQPIQIAGSSVGGIELIGKGFEKSIILKTTTAVGTGSNTARGGTVTDSYAKNAVLIITHPDNDYAYNTTIKGMSFRGAGYIVEYGIYAPRTTHTIFEDVQIFQCKYGWYTNDSWFTTFTKVIANCNSIEPNGVPSVASSSYGWVGSIAFWWDNDGTNEPTGTTLNAEQCWARDCSTGWSLFGLGYSVLNACGADNITSSPYFIATSRLTMNGCGSENVKLSNNRGVITNLNGRMVINSFQTFKINGASGCSMLFLSDGGNTTINNCQFDNFATVDGAANLVIQNNAHLFVNNSSLPSNGNSFVSYTGGSQQVNFNASDPFIISSDVSTSPRYWRGRVRDNQVRERVNKAIASAGTVIATLTAAGGGFDVGVCEFTVSYSDNSFPSGVGISKFLVAVYRDSGPNYRQSISTPNTAYATNGGAGAPAFALSRVGDVWSLTMTPQDGDCTVHTITAEMQNVGGITLALP